MRKLCTSLAVFALGALIACNNDNDTGEATTPSDSLSQSTNVPASPAMVDSVAVAKLPEHHRKHYKSKPQNETAHKKKKDKMVKVDSDPIEVADDAPEVIVLLVTTETPSPAPAASHKDPQGAHYYPDVPPSFPGGEKALDGYIEKNLDYPEKAIDQGVEGTVYVHFTVDANGKVGNVAAEKNKYPDGLTESAIDVVKNMPDWTAAQVDGKPASSRYKLPIRFEIKE